MHGPWCYGGDDPLVVIGGRSRADAIMAGRHLGGVGGLGGGWVAAGNDRGRSGCGVHWLG